MIGAALSLIQGAAGLVSIRSPFTAGAAAAGAGVFGLGLTLGLGALKAYDVGYASADARCERAALQSQLDAMTRDRDEARIAAADAALRGAAIQRKADADQKGTTYYVEQLKRQAASPACGLTCDDLRGMRIASPACAAGARAAGGAGHHGARQGSFRAAP
jgi:hypothetical protein